MGPDPKAARTPAEFVTTMRQLRTWADLSYRQVERNATQAGDILPRATISGALARTDLPREELLAAFVRACGGDPATVETWLETRRELAISAETTLLADTQNTPQNETTQHPTQDQQNTSVAAPPSSTADLPPAAAPADAQAHENTIVDVLANDSLSGNDGESTPPAAIPQPPTDPTSTTMTAQRPSPSPPDREARPRYLPMTLTGAAAAAGVLLIAFWPHGDSPTTAQPKSSQSAQASTPNTTSPATPSPTVSASASASVAPSTVPVQNEAEQTAPTPTTRPAPQPTPAPRKTSTPPRSAPQTGAVQIHPIGDSALCLTEGRERNGRTDREIAVQNPCGQANLPTVSLISAGTQTYRIQWDHPAHGPGCLAVDDASTGPGALLAPRDCADAAHQKYRLEPAGDGYRIRPVHSGLCIGILTPRTTGAEAIQQACTGTDDQIFRLSKP